jgi:hypothetical protein
VPGLRLHDLVLTVHRHEMPGFVASVPWWRRFEWDRYMLGWCAAFHLLMAVTLAFAPADQIVNAGTAPIFALGSRWFWAGAFLVAGLSATAMLWRMRVWSELLTWFTVIPLGFAWAGTFLMAVVDGRGSAIGLIVWPFLYVPWAVVAIRLALGKR